MRRRRRSAWDLKGREPCERGIEVRHDDVDILFSAGKLIFALAN
jgi:hypothetical protein